MLLLAHSALAQGSAVCAVDDANGDGVRDLAVASRERGEPETVWLLSGKDGALLRSWSGSTPNEGFGAALAQLGDLDGDGVGELAISVAGGTMFEREPPYGWGWTPGGTRGLLVVSPKSGAVVRRLEIAGNTQWGRPSVAPAGDWDRDGVDDVVLGVATPGHDRKSFVRVVSGKTGAALFEQSCDARGVMHQDELGAAVLGPGDLDDDEAPDLIIGAPRRREIDGIRVPEVASGEDTRVTAPDELGCVLVVSGKTGERIAASWGNRDGDRFGAQIALLPNLDGDGRREIAVTAPSRYVRVLSFDAKQRSLRTLCTIESHCGRGYTDEFGSSVSLVSDVDGDGKSDLVIGASELWPPRFFDEGYAEVWSTGTGKRIALLASSRTEAIDACALGDVDGDKVPDIALSFVHAMPVEAWCHGQSIRVVNAKDGTKRVWERTIASLRAEKLPGSK